MNISIILISVSMTLISIIIFTLNAMLICIYSIFSYIIFCLRVIYWTLFIITGITFLVYWVISFFIKTFWQLKWIFVLWEIFYGPIRKYKVLQMYIATWFIIFYFKANFLILAIFILFEYINNNYDDRGRLIKNDIVISSFIDAWVKGFIGGIIIHIIIYILYPIYLIYIWYPTIKPQIWDPIVEFISALLSPIIIYIWEPISVLFSKIYASLLDFISIIRGYYEFMHDIIRKFIIALSFSHYNKIKLSSPILPSIAKGSWNKSISSWPKVQKRSYSISSRLYGESVINMRINNKLPQTSEIESSLYITKQKLSFKAIKQEGNWVIVDRIGSQNESLVTDNYRDENQLTKARRYFPSATKEWYNSQYTYNTLEMRSILGLYITITKLIKAYFTSIPSTKKRMTGRRLLMTNKLYISKPELKHTSNKVTTTLYIFAGKKFNLTYLYRFLNQENFQDFSLSRVRDNNLLDLKNSIDKNPNIAKNFEFLKQNEKRIEKLYKLSKQLEKMRNLLEDKLSECYRKKQEIKLIRLKYLYLSNDMLSEYIALKLISKKRNLFRAKRKIFSKIKLPYFNKHLKDQISVARKNITLKSLLNKTRTNRGKIIWNIWRKNKYFRPDLPWNIDKFKESYKDFLNHIKYKFPVGIRLAIAGRLTKRNVASRSINKFTYIGRIKDIDSSYKNLSVSTLRGYIKASLEYNKFPSLAKTGAFTVKSWYSKNY